MLLKIKNFEKGMTKDKTCNYLMRKNNYAFKFIQYETIDTIKYHLYDVL